MMTDTNRDLVARLTDLLRLEHRALADFLVALADFDRRAIWREIGYANLFDFLHRELGLSKGTAFYRKTAAELVQRYPEVVEPIRDGRLCITSIIELARVITPENRAAVLPRFFHRSKQEAKAVSAEIAPVLAPPHRTMVTSTPPMVRGLDLEQVPNRLNQPYVSGSESCVPALKVVSDDQVMPPPSPPRDTNQPLSADLSRLHITVHGP